MFNKVLVATSCRAENARYSAFYRMRDELRLPEGSALRLFPGFFPDYNINDGVKFAKRFEFSHLFILDDDVILPPNTVIDLLKHDLDIVSVNMVTRVPPFQPYMYTEGHTEEARKNGLVIPDVLGDKKGIVEVAACGTGGMLIKVSVFDKLYEPYFSHTDTLKTYDLAFCHKARQAGFKIHVDMNSPAGHLVVGTVWPNRIEGDWVTTVVISDAIRFNTRAATKKEDGTLEMAGALR